MATTIQMITGCVLFAIIWVLLLKDRWPWLPLGRAVSAVFIGSLFVAFNVMNADEAFASINIPTLALLTGCMLISAHMEKQGLYDLLANSLASKGSPLSFLIRVSLVSAIASAIITNDSCCVVLTPLVLKACLQRKFNPTPYLIAVATNANIGSACSPIGNPQNMIIALLGHLYFSTFLGAIFVASFLGVIINTGCIIYIYRKHILHYDKNKDAIYEPTIQQLELAGLSPSTVSPKIHNEIPTVVIDPHTSTTTNHVTNDSHTNHTTDASVLLHIEDNAEATIDPALMESITSSANSEAISTKNTTTSVSSKTTSSSTPTPTTPVWIPISPWRRKLILFILAILPILFIAGDRWMGLSWISLLGGTLLCIIDGGKPEPLLARIDAQLLLFFSGLFVSVAGFNATGVPQMVWNELSSVVSMQTFPGVLVFTLLVVVGSNTVSNVPLTLLLGPSIASLPKDGSLAWLLLAWISTVAGNLTLLGSVANLIVAERAKDIHPLTFWAYAIVGIPSTIFMCILGVPLVWGFAQLLV